MNIIKNKNIYQKKHSSFDEQKVITVIHRKERQKNA